MAATRRTVALVTAALVAPVALFAGVTVPHVFSNNVVADAAQVNQNFTTLATAVDGTNARIDALGTLAAKSTITNGDVAANAAIAGTKVAPDFGAQAVTTTGTVTAGCPAGWGNYNGRFCYSPVQPATSAHSAEIACIDNFGARTCSVGEYYIVGTAACSGDYCWSNGYCGGTAGIRVRNGTGWECVVWNTNYQYRCCKPKQMG